MDGLEREWKQKVQFLHLDFRGGLGRELGRRFQIDHIPALLILDGAGQVQWRQRTAFPSRPEISSRLAELLSGMKSN